MAEQEYALGESLPTTWPFRVAGTLVLAAMIWFCLGFAVKDAGDELPSFFPLFFIALLVAFLFVLGGAAVNFQRERARRSG